jgi:hypothetical protein
MMRLFTKTYDRDLEWFGLAMLSVLKMCEEDLEWKITVERPDIHRLEKIIHEARMKDSYKFKRNISVHILDDCFKDAMAIKDGYLRQQWVKMTSYEVMGDGFYWVWDSDVVAVRPFNTKSFISKNGKPIYWFSQFNMMLDGSGKEAHQQRMNMMKEILDYPNVSFEWMRCMPIVVNGQILKHGRTQKEWDKSYDFMLNGRKGFSEFNVIGQFAHLYFPDAFDWRNAQNSGPTWGANLVSNDNGNLEFSDGGIACQSWSYGGIPRHIYDYVHNL